ncbi:MAG: lipoyl synthase [Dehalococcoidia bacterium]|nr:lipoyl synthase [Dehalococcoidia bacterium]
MIEALPKPEWLVVRSASDRRLAGVQGAVERHRLNTVCRSAQCPNIFECWHRGAVTVLILGDVCTRSCRFCATAAGDPRGFVDADEPRRVADFAGDMSLDYLVISSVARDDLRDGGAGVFAEVIERVRDANKGIRIEVLVPDFSGSVEALATVVRAKPDILGHNVETVKRLSAGVRDRKASYETSLKLLEATKRMDAELVTKSGLMLGLGEDRGEVIDTVRDLRAAGVDILTLGQYLQPSVRQLPVARYVTPEEFESLRDAGCELGFRSVRAGPFVRSSYHAGESYMEMEWRTSG